MRNPSVFGFGALNEVDDAAVFKDVSDALGDADADTGRIPMPDAYARTGAFEHRSLLWDDIRFGAHSGAASICVGCGCHEITQGGVLPNSSGGPSSAHDRTLPIRSISSGLLGTESQGSPMQSLPGWSLNLGMT